MMFEAQHIEKNYGDYRALQDVSIAVAERRIFGLLGPNGAGKTTLIRIINRITHADKGSLLFDGRPMEDADVRHIGYLPEERGLYKKMKVGEQALYLAQLKGLDRAEATRRLHLWFDKFGIDSWWNRRVDELSKGMQQKVQFVVTVLHRPRLLIFDEPFSGFDPVNANLLKQEIVELRENGATVIFSTHNMSSVEELCDDIALVNRSQVVLAGSVRDIRAAYSKNCYNVVLRSATPPDLSSAFEVDALRQERDTWHLQVTLPRGGSANDLLQQLMGHGEVCELHEVLPSMNDIFINTVRSSATPSDVSTPSSPHQETNPDPSQK